MFYKILYLLRYLVNSKKFKKFITFIALVFAIMSILELKYSKVQAAETISDSTYFDGVQATYKDYEGLQNEFVVRVLQFYKSNNYQLGGTYTTVLNRLNNGGFLNLFYYGDALGTYYQNTSPSASQKIVVELIQMDASSVTSNTQNFDWGLNGVQGVRGYLCNSNIYYELKVTRTSYNYQNLSPNIARHYMPAYLANYKSPMLVELLELYSTGQLNGDNADALITAIENQTDTIEEQGQQITNSINDTNDFLQEDVSNEVSTDLVVEPIEENEQQEEINDFVTYFPNKIAEEIADFDINAGRGNYYVEFTLPHTNGKKITFYSDAIYKYLVGTPFEIVVQMISFFWYLTLGGMIIIKIKRIYDWFAAGNFLREGEFIKFTDVLRGENEFFNQFMM